MFSGDDRFRSFARFQLQGFAGVGQPGNLRRTAGKQQAMGASSCTVTPKDSTEKTIGNHRATWLEKAFQAEHLDSVQLNLIKYTKGITALSGKGCLQRLQQVKNGDVIYSSNHCLQYNTACSVNPTHIKKCMHNDLSPKTIATASV